MYISEIFLEEFKAPEKITKNKVSHPDYVNDKREWDSKGYQHTSSTYDLPIYQKNKRKDPDKASSAIRVSPGKDSKKELSNKVKALRQQRTHKVTDSDDTSAARHRIKEKAKESKEGKNSKKDETYW